MSIQNLITEVNLDEQIDRIEKEVSIRSIADQLWGGQRGPGLIYAVAELSKAAVSLAESVNQLSKDIHGDGGMRNSLRELSREVETIKTDQQNVRVVSMRVIWFLCILGLATLLANNQLLFGLLADSVKK